MTIRYSVVGRDPQGQPVIVGAGVPSIGTNPFTFHPGGRWERILSGCLAEGRPLTRSEIAPYSRSVRQDHGGDVERRKLKRALQGLTKAGLLQKARPAPDQATWEPTLAGRTAIQTFGVAA